MYNECHFRKVLYESALYMEVEALRWTMENMLQYYASIFAVPELWNRLQGADCNDKRTSGVAKLRDRIGEDRDAADLFPGLQNHPCATSAQSVF